MAGFVHLATNLLNFILTHLYGKFKHLVTSQNGLYSIVYSILKSSESA